MGDMSAEPSMEDILSSIKRIIAEEGDTAVRAKRAPARATPRVADVAEPVDEVLELSEPLAPEPDQPVSATAAETLPESGDAPIVSAHAAQASRGALSALSRMMVKPEPSSDGTLEGLVRELLRPMLREWLDDNLPALVESMVAREIERISQNR